MEQKTAVEKLNEFQRFGSVLGLERMERLMAKLGNPEKELKYIHVAGTNGKGSVCRFIYEALRANGYSVGLYTSPFLTVFNERIEADGEYIADNDLEEITSEVLAKVDEITSEGYDSPTEFEVITAIAFVYFAQRKCDFVVLEVGLGGRGDSTNIIEKPLVSIITSISYDHTDRLGNTLAEIAGEKAGIIKPGVPVVMNVPEREAAAAIARVAYQKGSRLYDVSKIKYGNIRRDITGTTFDTDIYETEYHDVDISMLGKHQIANAMTALTALEIMRKNRDIKVERSKLYAGINSAKVIGRFEVMSGHEPYVVLDGAHNQAGSEALLETVRMHFEGQKILTVIGVLADKDSDQILENMCNIGDEFIATEPPNPRKLEAEKLAEKIRERGKVCDAISSPDEALREALKRGYEGDCDVVLFAGSLYLIGYIRGGLENEKQGA